MRSRDIVWLMILGGFVALMALYRREPTTGGGYPQYPGDGGGYWPPDVYLAGGSASSVVDQINRSLYYYG